MALIDLREHGRSQGAPPPHTINAAAHDLRELAAVLELDGKRVRGVLGHSFGGKVALRYRQLAGSELATTWVIDASPSSDPNAMFAGRAQPDSTVSVIDMLESLPTRFARREDAIAVLLERGAGTAMASWLAMNYEGDGGEVVLRLDLASVRSLLEDYYAQDLWDAIDEASLPGDLHAVVAGRSRALGAGDRDVLAALAASDPERVFVHTIPDAGHWVHIEAPDRLRELVAAHLPAI
jgi:pimeloyl-ACP methyl ester carboxylesterase